MRDPLPLEGVRVLDLTRLLPGPFATQQLADMGADVVKIEDLGAGDYTHAATRALINRRKRGIRIDLKQPRGLATFLRLACDADVIVEGFRPGVMKRLGADYETVASENPRIVYCSISGFGQQGPLAQMPAHDINYIALAGVADQVGNEHGPALSNLPLGDLLGGTMTAAMRICAALYGAARSGRGAYLDVAIADGVLAQAVLPRALLHERGRVPALGEARLTGALPCYGFYRTSDGRWLAVGALEPKFWDALCDRLARADLKPLHEVPRARAELQSIFAARPLAHWTALFEGSEACVAPVLRLDETLAHPHFVARGVAADPPGPAPAPGEHTREILDEAGFGADEIESLLDARAIA